MRFLFCLSAEVSYHRQVLGGAMAYAQRAADIDIDMAYSRVWPIEPPRSGYDGLILSDAAAEGSLSLPAIVVSNNRVIPGVPTVFSDDRAIGAMVAEHLMGRGHRRLGYCGGSDVYCQERAEGFEKIARARGIGEVIRFHADPDTIARVLPTLPLPVGVMGSNDGAASLLIAACRRARLRVPEDVAVVGVDDDDLYAATTKPPLSTVAQRTDRIGALAVELLIKQVRGETVAPATLVPPGALLIRQSSERFNTADPLLQRAIRVMEQRLAQQANIDDVLAVLPISRRSLETKFREAFGCTPARFLLSMRIERAQELLSGSRLANTRIAGLAGFSTPVRFNQAFRRVTGQTPGAYRRQFL